MTDRIDWDRLQSLPISDLKQDLFAILQDASRAIQTCDREESWVLELVPRIAHLLEQRSDLSDFVDPFSSLARGVGLWNYIAAEDTDFREQVLAESMSQGEKLEYVTLHREQARALSTILDGKNLVLSAPTSFGKSLLIDAAIASNRYERIAIIVPTLALLDQARRRLTKRFGDEFDVIMHHSEKPRAGKVIFLGTQERLINRRDLGSLDLVVIDEFYKLDSTRADGRAHTLNAAAYQIMRSGRQFIFLGPNVERLIQDASSPWEFEFQRTKFATVAVDTIDLTHEENKFGALKAELFRNANWPALVFVSSPERANELGNRLVQSGPAVGSGQPMAEWLIHNFGRRWELSKAVARGIAVHHGRIPRAVASRFVQMFNERTLPILICTSTLIEGVNTAAKSVFIYDNSIANRRYDFFTFSNIRGRAGRLGEHHVGKVYLFNAPPPESEAEVDAPLFDSYEDAPDDFVVHLDDADMSEAIRSRVDTIAEELDLTIEELKRFSSIGIEDLRKVRLLVRDDLKDSQDLEWHHWPQWRNLLACCRIICAVRRARYFGARSHRQLALFLHRLRISWKILEFFQQYSSTYWGRETDMDQIFRFLRACEYSLPEFFAAIELFVRKFEGDANYGLALRELPRWFKPEPLKVLEERGIPMQISERFLRKNDTPGQLGRRLIRAAQSKESDMTNLERDWILGMALR